MVRVPVAGSVPQPSLTRVQHTRGVTLVQLRRTWPHLKLRRKAVSRVEGALASETDERGRSRRSRSASASSRCSRHRPTAGRPCQPSSSCHRCWALPFRHGPSGPSSRIRPGVGAGQVAQVRGWTEDSSQPGIGHQAVSRSKAISDAVRVGGVVASIGCSFSGTWFSVSERGYPRFRGAPFCFFRDRPSYDAVLRTVLEA